MNTIPSLLSRTTSLIKSMLLMTLLLILILTCSACSKLKDTNDTLRLYLESDPITLDPALITDVRSGRLSALIYNNLFKYDYDLRLKPDLVESWSISPDHLLYSFTLKDSVYFSSGKKLSTADIQYTFYRLLDKKTRSPRAWILYHIEGAKDYRDGKTDHISGLILKDSLHFSIRLEKPYSPFLSLLTMPNAAIIPSGNNSTDFSEHPVGTGPFILTFWKHDYEIFFTSNIHYFSGSPKTRSISYKIIKEPLFVSSEFRRGRIDIMQIPGPELPLYRNDPSYAENIKVQNELNVYYMGFNCQNIPFSHLETRQAIIYGIDKEILINTLRKDRVIMLNSPIPQGIPGYDNSAPKHQFAPSKTKKIIN
ncbi:MAG: ABC transporter substrate-binding protein, partial [Chlamydiota bacterium]|nr:ABC transporter substrate-binding protein [Chlamydiota bacterium]